MGAVSVVNVDLATNIRGAVLSDLDTLPFASNRFDTVICNAVLEHVSSIETVMAELRRVLRPGGHMIVAIPFLQPYHEAPTDFRRFTYEGMKQLGQTHGLDPVEIFPVHTIAQTLGWVFWEYLVEKNNPVLKRIFWPIIWAATRYSYKSDLQCVRSANTFQAVYRKSS
jgi:ubiquinone/menaquinone biosynthesis C-methylase UbiE